MLWANVWALSGHSFLIGKSISPPSSMIFYTPYLLATTRLGYAKNLIAIETVSQVTILFEPILIRFLDFRIGIVVWIVLGIPVQISNEWQLYINTITALSLTLTSVFLQNIQQQQEDNLDRSLEYALKVDAEVEYRLREITADTKSNPIHEILLRPLSRSERAIAHFPAIMGSGLGALMSLIALVAWLAVGPILKFDDN